MKALQGVVWAEKFIGLGLIYTCVVKGVVAPGAPTVDSVSTISTRPGDSSGSSPILVLLVESHEEGTRL